MTGVAGGIITLEEALRGLNYDVKQRVEGEPLIARDQSVVDAIKAATPLVEKMIGSVLPRTRTQLVDGGRSGVLLDDRIRGDDPELVVVQDGKTLDGVTVDVAARILYPGSGSFAAGRLKVTYPVGFEAAEIPSLIKSAVVDIVVTWIQQKQSTVPDFEAASDASDGAIKMGFAVPRRAAEKLKVFRLIGSEFG